MLVRSRWRGSSSAAILGCPMAASVIVQVFGRRRDVLSTR
jgi:hypothetical protein